MTAVMLVAGAVIFGAIWVIDRRAQHLDGGDDAVRQRVHLRWQLPVAVPDRRLRGVAAAGVRLPAPGGLRELLPRAVHPRSAVGTWRSPRCGSLSPLVAARRRVRRRLDLAPRHPPLPEHGQLTALIELDDVEKTFVRRAARRPAAPRAHRSARRGRRQLRGARPARWSATSAPTAPGKSTTIKMLTGILVPSGGRIEVAGVDPQRRRVELARRIGVVFGQRTQLWWDLPAARLVRAAAPRVPGAAPIATARTSTRSSTCSISATCSTRRSASCRSASACGATSPPRCCTTPRSCSSTSRRSASTSSARRAVRDFLARRQPRAGHDRAADDARPGDIERLCPRMLIIDHGKVIYDGAVDAIKERLGGERTLVVDLEEEAPPLDGRPAPTVRAGGRAAGSGCASGATDTTAAAARRRGRGPGAASSTWPSRSPTSKRSSAAST